MSELELVATSVFGYSEEEMAQAFENLLLSKEGLPRAGPFDAVYREVACRQGRPDFIALRYNSPLENRNSISIPGFVGPAILQNLNPTTPRTFEYLAGKLEFCDDSIRKALRMLLEKKLIERSKKEAYRLTSDIIHEKPEVWAFELKLNNPKRAVFQAQQSRAYAERAIIVVPPGREKNYERFRDPLNRWHIGLATFDPVTGVFRFIKKGRKVRAFSPAQQTYTLSQLSRMCS